jgi:hypothetical protein
MALGIVSGIQADPAMPSRASGAGTSLVSNRGMEGAGRSGAFSFLSTAWRQWIAPAEPDRNVKHIVGATKVPLRWIWGQAWLLLSFAALMWAANAVAARIAVGHISPMMLVSLPWLCISLVLVIAMPSCIHANFSADVFQSAKIKTPVSLVELVGCEYKLECQRIAMYQLTMRMHRPPLAEAAGQAFTMIICLG